MLLYNITVIIEDDSAEHWLNWLKTEKLPELSSFAAIQSSRIFRIVDSPNEGQSFSLQFMLNKEADFEQTEEYLAQYLSADMYSKYPNKLVAFTSLMQHLDQ